MLDAMVGVASHYRYYEVKVAGKKWKYCYSVGKNINGKYVLWTNRSDVSASFNVVELNKKKTCILRAKQRMMNHLRSLGKYSELAKWEPQEKLTRVEVF